MVILRRLAPILQHIQLTPRFYARKTVTATDADMKQVHQQTLRYVNPYSRIEIDSDIFVKVNSADPHEYQSGDALIAELHGGPVKNCTASMVVKVGDDERNVEVILRKLADCTDFHCELAVPAKASLHIITRHGAQVKNTHGEMLKVIAEKFINTDNICAEKIELFTSEGDIVCNGILLGKETDVETQKRGNIFLDKLQGDNIKCKTIEGNITTNCSYVESSEFGTETGSLHLKNIHKNAAVHVYKKGELKMTGVHGNLKKVFINEGSMNIQLSELQGTNIIETKNLSSCVINISDDIEKNTSLDITLTGEDSTSSISLDTTLEHLSRALAGNMKQLKWPLDQERPNKLKVISRSSLCLRKSSWTEMMCMEINEKQNN